MFETGASFVELLEVVPVAQRLVRMARHQGGKDPLSRGKGRVREPCQRSVQTRGRLGETAAVEPRPSEKCLYVQCVRGGAWVTQCANRSDRLIDEAAFKKIVTKRRDGSDVDVPQGGTHLCGPTVGLEGQARVSPTNMPPNGGQDRDHSPGWFGVEQGIDMTQHFGEQVRVVRVPHALADLSREDF